MSDSSAEKRWAYTGDLPEMTAVDDAFNRIASTLLLQGYGFSGHLKADSFASVCQSLLNSWGGADIRLLPVYQELESQNDSEGNPVRVEAGLIVYQPDKWSLVKIATGIDSDIEAQRIADQHGCINVATDACVVSGGYHYLLQPRVGATAVS